MDFHAAPAWPTFCNQSYEQLYALAWGWCRWPETTRTAQAVQQPMRQAQGSSRPCSSASCSTYLAQAHSSPSAWDALWVLTFILRL